MMENAPAEIAAVDWAVVIVALIGATSLGTRLLVWCVEHAKLLSILADVIERACSSGDSADSIKSGIATTSKALGVMDLAQKIAAKAETDSGRSGGATDARRESKGARFLRGLKKWLPIIGGLV